VYGSSLLGASSLVRTYDQWQIAGDVTQRYSDALTKCLAEAPTAGQVNLTALPSSLDDGRVETSLLGVTLLEDWTIDSVLRLVVPERRLGLHVSSWGTVRGAADTLSFQCAGGRDAIDLTTLYRPA
jgi:hypothetical protein